MELIHWRYFINNKIELLALLLWHRFFFHCWTECLHKLHLGCKDFVKKCLAMMNLNIFVNYFKMQKQR